MGLRVMHAGQDITLYVDEFTITVESVLGQGAGVAGGGSGRSTTCSFTARLGPAAKAIGAGETPHGADLVRQGEVIIYDATDNPIFGGFATQFDDATPISELVPQTTISCHDYLQDLDRVMVNEVYTGRSDTYIIRDLLTKYAPWIDRSLIPSTDNFVFEKRLIRAHTLREAVQQVADTLGWMIWIDANKVFHYAAPTAMSTAPFSLSDNPNFIDTHAHAVTKYTRDDNAIINRVYFYGGKNPSPDFDQGLSVQANGSNKTFSLLYFPHDATDGSIHVIKNGVEQVVYSVFDTNPTHQLISAGGTADVLVNRDAEVLIFNTAPLKTDTLICRYRYNTPLVLVLSSTKSYQKFGRWYDGKISDTNVFDIATALQRARVLLAEQTDGLTSLTAVCWKGGLQAGQLLYIKNWVRGLDETFIIQKVTTKPQGAGSFEYTVEMGAWNWNLVDLLMWQARSNSPADDNTEEDMSIIQAQEAAVAGTVVVAFTTRTTLSGTYYSRTTDPGDGMTAYSGFFTVTS